MTSIIFVLKLMMLTSVPSAATVQVDRVESDYGRMAVVCVDGDCRMVIPTVAVKRGGLREDQTINACETVKRGDGTSAIICGGSVKAFIGVDGTRHANPYAIPANEDCAVY